MTASDTPNDRACRIALFWSGGKDALFALSALQSEDATGPVALVTTVVEGAETVQAHGTPLAFVRRQAEALGLPLHVAYVPPRPSNTTYEARLERTLAPLQARGITHVAAGDLHLRDVRAYREGLIRRLGFDALFPVWGRDTQALAREASGEAYRVVVTSVDTEQLDASFAGRLYDATFLADLPDGTDPCGEDGAFHTFVAGAPSFRQPVPVRVAGTTGTGRMRYAVLRDA
jgi:uncharacterized protein (TIGR00290 family)